MSHGPHDHHDGDQVHEIHTRMDGGVTAASVDVGIPDIEFDPAQVEHRDSMRRPGLRGAGVATTKPVWMLPS